MRYSEAKDTVLKCLYESDKQVLNSHQISKRTGVDFNSVFTACKELGEIDKLIQASYRTGYGEEPSTYNCLIMPPGKNWIERGKSFRKEEVKQAWIDFPKNKWWLLDPVKIIIGAAIGVGSTLLIQYINKVKTTTAPTIKSTPAPALKSAVRHPL